MKFDHQMMREYLLGGLPEDQAAELDERLFHDQDFSLALRIEQGTLVEEFVEGRLSRQDDSLFRAQCLRSPLLRKEVRSLRALLAANRRQAQPERPPKLSWRWMLVPVSIGLAAIVVMVVVLVQSHETRKLEAKLDTLPQTAPVSVRPVKRNPDVVAFLSAVIPRGPADLPEIVIPQNASRVDLEVELRGAYSEENDWHTDLLSGKAVVWQSAHLARSQVGQESFLRVTLDGKSMTPGFWLVRFYPSANPAAIETRSFRVNRSPLP
jgi:hypothetical protein